MGTLRPGPRGIVYTGHMVELLSDLSTLTMQTSASDLPQHGSEGETNILVDTVSYNDEVDLTPNGEHPPVILLHCHSWREKPCRHEGPMAGR